jgi:hypothetical protein
MMLPSALRRLLARESIADIKALKRLVTLWSAPGVLNTHTNTRIASVHQATVFKLAGIPTPSLGQRHTSSMIRSSSRSVHDISVMNVSAQSPRQTLPDGVLGQQAPVEVAK